MNDRRRTVLVWLLIAAGATLLGTGLGLSWVGPASATHAGPAVGCPDGTDRGTVILGGLTPDYSNGATVTDGDGNQLGVLPGDNADHAFPFTGIGVGGTLTVTVTSLASPQHRAGDYTHTFTFTVENGEDCTPVEETTTTAAPPTTTPATSPPTAPPSSAPTASTSPGGSTPPADETSTTQPILPETGKDRGPLVAMCAAGLCALAAGGGLQVAGRRR